MSQTAAPLADRNDGPENLFPDSPTLAPTAIAVDFAERSSGAVRRISGFGVAVAAISAVPVWRVTSLSENVDVGVITTLVFAGAAWNLWRFVPPRNATSPVAAILWWGILTWMTWQLATIAPEDFWFVRTGLVLSGLALAGLWGGVGRGWRAGAAISLWAFWLHVAQPLEKTLSGDWICERTAACAGWLLWQCGQDISVEGSLMFLPGGGVRVGGPCTGVPLASLLAVLVLIAGLLLRLRSWTIMRLGILTLGLSFLIGVGRVALLAMVVGDKGMFNYWHSPEGAAWFSAISIVLLAWLISRVPPAGYQSAHDQPVTLIPQRLRRVVWPIGAMVGAAWMFAAPQSTNVGPLAATPVFDAAHVEQSETRRHPISTRPHNQFAWEHDVVYALEGGAARVRVTLALLPLMLGDDPRWLENAPAWVKDASEWSRAETPHGPMWVTHGDADLGWVAAFTPEGRAIRDPRDWQASYLAGFREGDRWWTWLKGERPMCDKSAFFLALRWEGAQGPDVASEAVLTAALSAWQQRVREIHAVAPLDAR